MIREQKLEMACMLVLMFHSGEPWTDDKRLLWANYLTQLLGPAVNRPRKDGYHHQVGYIEPTNEATTRNLCDAVRAALQP